MQNEQEMTDYVKRDIYGINYIINPTERMKLEVVRQDGYYIKYIKDPTEQVQITAVKQNGYAIKYIKNPSEQVRLAAVNQSGCAIQYIKNPSEQVKSVAVNQDGRSIQYIENPSEQLKLNAIKNCGYSIIYFENPSEQIQIEAVKNIPRVIEYIRNPSERVKLEAIKKDAYVIQYIKSFNIEPLIPELNTIINPKNPEYIVEPILDFINNFNERYKYDITDYQYYDNIFYFLLSNLDTTSICFNLRLKETNETTKNIIETVKQYQRNKNVKSQVGSLIHLLKKHNKNPITEQYLSHKTYHSSKRK